MEELENVQFTPMLHVQTHDLMFYFQQCTKVINRTVIETRANNRFLTGDVKRTGSITGDVTCKECCSSDICNAYGCGSPGTMYSPRCNIIYFCLII